jgi:hypothetical protein
VAPNGAIDYLDDWLVGFIEAESCFSTYTALGETNPTSSFEISKTQGEQVILAIRKRLSIKPLPNGGDQYQFSTSSKWGLQLVVINFLNDY